MSKILKLKRWLTLTETAKRLSIVLEDDVSIADVLRFAIDGHFPISVNFTNLVDLKPAYLYCPVTYLNEIDQLLLKPLDIIDKETVKVAATSYLDYCLEIVAGGRPTNILPHKEGIATEERILSADGIFDLPMLGAEKLDILQALNDEIDGPEITDVILDGPILQKNGNLYQIQNSYRKDGQHRLHYYPADRLPDGSTLIIRTDALREFELSLLDAEHHVEVGNYSGQENPPATTERHTQYRSDKLSYLIQASDRFWANADPNDRTTHPTNNDVAAWLESKSYTATLAQSAASIIRPEWAGTGRKPEK